MVRSYLSEIGKRGGEKSRRKLSADDARSMVAVREGQRAYKKFHAQCFWSFRKDFKVKLTDIPWIKQQLMKNGDLEGWKIANRLCH